MLPNVAARNDYSKLNALIRGRIATSTKTTVSSYTEIVDCEEEAVACHTATFFLILCLLAPFNCSWVSLAGRDAVTASLMSHLRTEDSHCSSYISAYGVSIAQYQRIESNWKSFQSICRAPSSASIDFVVIFTHDTDYYKDALPGPVHIDSSGFSDWSAIVTLDNTRPAE